MRTALVVLGLATVLASNPSSAQIVEAVDHTALRVCADPSALPYSARDGSGFENRIAALLARDLGVQVRYTWFPNTIGFFRRTLNARRCDLVIGAPAEMEMAQATIPYYRSTFLLVTRAGDNSVPAGLDATALHGKRIGVQARTPAADLLGKVGLIDDIRAYDLLVDSRVTSVGRQMIEDLMANRIDAAIIWGPVASYQASLHPGALRLLPLGERSNGVQLAYDIAMGVRNGEPQWRARIDRFIRERHGEIDAILAAAGVPTLPPRGGTP